MASVSPSAAIKQVEGQVQIILRQVNMDTINEKGRKAAADLRQSLADARIYANDYELSEMRDEQVTNGNKAKKFLEQARQQILRASEFNVFSAIDVAHITAQLDQVKADLK